MNTLLISVAILAQPVGPVAAAQIVAQRDSIMELKVKWEYEDWWGGVQYWAEMRDDLASELGITHIEQERHSTRKKLAVTIGTSGTLT